MGRRAAGIEVAEHDRAVLAGWARRPKTAQALAQRAQIILRLGQGHSSSDVAQQVQVHIQTVSKWRERLRTRGVDGLLDEPRPGQPRKITDAHVEAVIARTLEELKSYGHAHRARLDLECAPRALSAMCAWHPCLSFRREERRVADDV